MCVCVSVRSLGATLRVDVKRWLVCVGEGDVSQCLALPSLAGTCERTHHEDEELVQPAVEDSVAPPLLPYCSEQGAGLLVLGERGERDPLEVVG